jgi:hypothetical protein
MGLHGRLQGYLFKAVHMVIWFPEVCRRTIWWLGGTNVSEKPASFMFGAEEDYSSTEKRQQDSPKL